jgi:site-specific DNA-methyltransferase (adenine-specific)
MDNESEIGSRSVIFWETQMTKTNQLFYGDNLEVLRYKIRDQTIDLCYIDPPFNSKRNYNQIYNNMGEEDRAQAQAFIDTWIWDDLAEQGFMEILANERGAFPSQTVDLIKGLFPVLSKGSILAYLVSMTLRITEIRRVLKENGSFFLHCDPTASHYLKLILDSVFVANGGTFRNEIIWCYTGPGSPGMRQFMRKHDVIFWYTKSETWQFNRDDIRTAHKGKTVENYKSGLVGSGFAEAEHKIHADGKVPEDWWEFAIAPRGKEYMGYPTQKPEKLLDRIIRACSKEGDLVLDAYCGCGTTIAVAERLKRAWIGIDITYQSIALVLRRLEGQSRDKVIRDINLAGIPRDIASANALAKKKDDRLRKEFEKWAILTYANNRAIINDKKGGDKGIDGISYFLTGKNENAKVVFQVKSGHVERGDISKLNNDRAREKAELGIFITLEPPTAGMKTEAKEAGTYMHETMGRGYPRIMIVTVKEILEDGKRLDIPMSLEVLAAAKRASEPPQLDLLDNL